MVAAVGFVVVEGREREPMLPLGIFRDRTFSAANVMTLLVYGALGAVSFFVTIQLQTVSGYGALAAGAGLRADRRSSCCCSPRAAAGSACGSGRGSR